VLETKEVIRKEILTKLNNQPRVEVLRKSEIIKDKLFSLAEFKKAKFVMLYASMAKEVHTLDMIDEAIGMGKRVVLPLCASRKVIIPKEITDRNKDLKKGAYNILEPQKNGKSAKPRDIDLFIVPGVAFDKKNRRLGRGRGYYDRFLQKVPHDKVIIGLAFNLQIVENLPHDSHDIPVSKVITD